MHVKDLVLTGIFLLVIALRGLGAPAAQSEGEARSEGEALLEPAAAALEVPRNEKYGLELSEVLARFQEVSGWTVLMSDETRRLIERYSQYSNGPLRAEPEHVFEVVEAVLASNKCVWSVTRAEAPRILTIQSLDTTARTSARQNAIYVPVEQIERYADHPALLVETVLSLPNTDVRTLSNSMRGMVVDPNTLQIIPVGNSSELILQGFGRNVADVVAMLREVDLRSGPDGADAVFPSRAPRPLRAKGETTLPAMGESSMTLLELVMRFADATGQTALISDESARLLEQTRLGLESPMTISGAQLPTLFEELLLQHNYVVTPLLDEPALFTVRSLDTTARTSARQDARFVDRASLDACAGRPATLFQTVIDLPHVDVRTLSNSMRSMVVDPNTLQLIPVGNSSSLILQGFGRNLVRLRDMLAVVEAAAAARPVVEPEPEGGEEQ